MEEIEDSFRFSISYDTKNNFSFEKLRSSIELNGISEKELLQNLSKPIIYFFMELEKKNDSDYIERFKNNRIINIEDKFETEIGNKVKICMS